MALLASYGRIVIGPGLTQRELDRTEREHGFSFADDHRAFLAAGLPQGRGWPDWRDSAQVHDRLIAPVEGVLFDVAENGFWYEGWGARPPSTGAALTAARTFLLTAPRLIPLHGHRYLPAGRGTTGHPVLSVMQTDVIVYGNDIEDWIRREFGGAVGPVGARPTVPFWKDVSSGAAA
ncbi:hypothetical protein L083_6492 [Actinoplanes sp. N902-109]|nr:hypothetical protein L083_6492 [Actinoplanes sp. N902-109]